MKSLPTTLAYLAGAMDADGHFSIKKSFAQRAANGQESTVYYPRIGLGQVTPEVPELLKSVFGGNVYLQKSKHKNRKDQYKWSAQNGVAYRACEALRSYLLLKKERAELLMSLYEWQHDKNVRRPTWWWLRENPRWQTSELLTRQETRNMMNISEQRLRNALVSGFLVAANNPSGHPQIPGDLVAFLLSLRGKKHYRLPPQYLRRCESLFEQCRELNSLGKAGTCVTHRTGCFKLKK
jgi:hypothetical protein